VAGVTTAQGRIDCDVVVLCTGQWTRQLAATVGVNVPLVSVEHQYLITEPIGVPRDLPTLRDPDRLTYYKEEVGGLVMGGYEPNPKPWATRVPDDFSFQLLDGDWEHFAPTMELAIGRVPRLAEAGINTLVNGPESFTPDGMFILGEAPELRNCFVGAGFNAFGIAAGGGAGMALAEWIVSGAPPYDLWNADIRRFGRPHRSTEWVRDRTLEAYAKHYTMAWPFEEHSSGRPCRRSPLYDRLLARGACFGEKLGWERPNWFAAADLGEQPHDEYSYGRQNWFRAVGREHRAMREAAALIDQTSFAKFVLKGPDAPAALDWLCANEVDKPIGSLTYTQMLDPRGGIQCDVTVARTSEHEYLIVTGTGFATHDFHWIERHLPERANAQLVDVTSATSVLALMGPRSRDILAELSEDDLSNAAFPFGSVRRVGLAGCEATALRITYVGELGYELHVPVELAATVYDRIMAAGQRHGLVDAGYRAIESCRLEKGYRAWGADIGPDYTPLEAGLGWAVKDRTDVAFLGRDAIVRQRSDGVRRCLAGFTTDPSVVLLGRETIYRDGLRVGWLSSAGFGYTIDRSIGYGYVRNAEGATDDFVTSGTYELEVATRRVPAEVSLKPFYDPRGERVRV
jgi:4-methylaminobutanoate oxidase (formaldehyde-forming)